MQGWEIENLHKGIVVFRGKRRFSILHLWIRRSNLILVNGAEILTALKKFINYSHYNNYSSYKMENTTIAVSNEIREKIKEFGNKGETYSEVLARLLESAKKRQLQDLLMNEEDTISIDEAISNSKKRWQK